MRPAISSFVVRADARLTFSGLEGPDFRLFYCHLEPSPVPEVGRVVLPPQVSPEEPSGLNGEPAPRGTDRRPLWAVDLLHRGAQDVTRIAPGTSNNDTRPSSHTQNRLASPLETN